MRFAVTIKRRVTEEITLHVIAGDFPSAQMQAVEKIATVDMVGSHLWKRDPDAMTLLSVYTVEDKL